MGGRRMIFTPDEQAELFEIVRGFAEQCTLCRWMKQRPSCEKCRSGDARKLVDKIIERQKNGSEMPRHHNNGDEPLEH